MNLTIENKKDIIKYLWHERIVLLKQLVTTQELLIKIKQESSDHNPQIQKITKDAKKLAIVKERLSIIQTELSQM